MWAHSVGVQGSLANVALEAAFVVHRAIDFNALQRVSGFVADGTLDAHLVMWILKVKW